jgi:hypothetical protein
MTPRSFIIFGFSGWNGFDLPELAFEVVEAIGPEALTIVNRLVKQFSSPGFAAQYGVTSATL